MAVFKGYGNLSWGKKRTLRNKVLDLIMNYDSYLKRDKRLVDCF